MTVSDFAKQIKEGTKKSHSAAENTSFVKSFLKGVVNKESYWGLISDFYFVYSALEVEVSKLQDHPVVGTLDLPELRRKLALEGLESIGLPINPHPDGAFYAFFDISKLEKNSMKLASEILTSTGVSLAPGKDFGPKGEGHLRLSYCNSNENIEKGINLIGKFLKEKYL